MTKRPLKILTLLARHGTAKYADALPQIKALFARQMPDVAHDCVIADNSLALGYQEVLPDGEHLIGASNEAWEFSAWDSAVAYMGSRLHDYDFVHLATSAFRQLYVKYLDRFDTRMLALAKGRAMAVGHIDYYNEAVVLLGQRCQSWLRTSFVMLAPAEIAMLGSFVSVKGGERFFSGHAPSPFLESAPVSLGYRQNILGWLTGEGTGQNTEWHSRFRLDDSTLAYFESKAMAIFNEQMLSNRLRAQGCAVVDATWLATRASQGGKAGLAVPNWRVQVSSRDTDAAPQSILI